MSERSIAFFYGEAPPMDELRHFARVVVEPDHLEAGQPAELKRAGVELYAYLSAGEYDRVRPGDGAVDQAWFLADNPRWHSRVADPLAPGWRDFVVARAVRLAGRGYPNLFLDTLDSPLAIDDKKRAERTRAVADLVRAIHARLPRARLLINRAFEILPEVAPMVAGVVAESLFRSFDPRGGGSYAEVSEADSGWLAERLRGVRERQHLPITVIDYVAPADRQAARRDAARIAALGFAPWVADGGLVTLGVGAVEVQPRRVMVLAGEERRRVITAALAPRGYIVDEPSPEGAATDPLLAGRVAVILDARGEGDEARQAWLIRQRDAGCAIVRLDGGAVTGEAIARAAGLAPLPLPLAHAPAAKLAATAVAAEAPRYTVARRADGTFELRGIAGLRAVIVDAALGRLDPARCRNVTIARAGDGRHEVRLTGAEPAIVAFIAASAGDVEGEREGAPSGSGRRGHR